jgi:dienelactone hydrolase
VPRIALCLLLAVLAGPCAAAMEIANVETRYLKEGKRASVRILVNAPRPGLKAWLLEVPGGRGVGWVKETKGKPEYGFSLTPFARISEGLKALGIGHAVMEAPSDHPDGVPGNWFEDPDHHQDIGRVVQFLRDKYGGLPVHLGGYAGGAAAALVYGAQAPDNLAGIVLVGGYYTQMREFPAERVRAPVLMLHAASNRCGSAPVIEARELARQGRYALVEVYYKEWGRANSCGTSSQTALNGRDAELLAALAKWIAREPLPEAIGDPKVGIAFNEQVHFFDSGSGLGTNRLEMTLYLPRGTGPFPLLVFSHGDIALESSHIRRKTRVRDFDFATVFLDLGIAVAFPARPGVGMSQGSYQRGFSRNDGDALYKGKVHAQEIFAAVEYLRKLPQIARDRIVLSGQSAGGYASSTAGGMNPEWLAGVINFSGGRTDILQGEQARGQNRMMIEGFAELGRTTRVPVLLVFAENDSRYSAETIRACHEAFMREGGKATLALYPPQPGDGHHVIANRALWNGEVKRYLASIGLTKAEN